MDSTTTPLLATSKSGTLLMVANTRGPPHGCSSLQRSGPDELSGTDPRCTYLHPPTHCLLLA